MNEVEIYADKARESLAGVLSELAYARYNNAANRAYFAAYQAAIVALIRAGVSSRNDRWDHDKVQARFARDLVARRKLFPSESRRTLYELALTRNNADYGLGAATRRDAAEAVGAATTFVSRIVRGTPG